MKGSAMDDLDDIKTRVGHLKPEQQAALREWFLERDQPTDRSLFLTDAETHQRFKAALDAPPQPNSKLIRTMR
jgi:hypothetical protein